MIDEANGPIILQVHRACQDTLPWLISFSLDDSPLGMMRWRFWLRLVWLCVAALVLLVSLAFFTPSPGSEVTGILVFCMFVLSFPLGWLAYAGTTLPADYAGPIYQSRLLLAVAWALFVLAGYLQWFVVVRGLFSALRRLRGSHVI